MRLLQPTLAISCKVADKETCDYKEVALCKETLAMWAKIVADYKKVFSTIGEAIGEVPLRRVKPD
jgi:hypothetical protein